jgi:hypothetical protein
LLFQELLNIFIPINIIRKITHKFTLKCCHQGLYTFLYKVRNILHIFAGNVSEFLRKPYILNKIISHYYLLLLLLLLLLPPAVSV